MRVALTCVVLTLRSECWLTSASIVTTELHVQVCEIMLHFQVRVA